jgi:ribonuclease HII
MPEGCMPIPTRGLSPGISRERRLLRQGFRRVAGLDEVGRGAWAGPLAAAAVILPVDSPTLRRDLAGVRDSKLMTPKQRAAAAGKIRSAAIAWSVACATAGEVDAIGPLRATRLAMMRAIAGLPEAPDHLLIDYLRLIESPLPQLSILHGDTLCLSVAAASVLAKTWRDEQMTGMAREYPDFHFERHKGYGTRAHREALACHGPCPEHRRSYAPIRELLAAVPV